MILFMDMSGSWNNSKIQHSFESETEIEICKIYIEKSIEILKVFEKKDKQYIARIATKIPLCII